MKNIKSSVIAKFTAWFLLIVSVVVLAGSIAGAVAFEACEFYDRTFDQSRRDAFEALSDRYSAMVLGQMDIEGLNEEYFAEKNFKYGIIKAENKKILESLDLNSDKTYVERNFTEEVALEDLNLFECYISEDTYFSSHNPDSLLGSYYISHTNPAWAPREIREFGYDLDSGIFYIYCENGKYYPIQNILFSAWSTDYEEIGWVASYEFDSEIMAYRLVEMQEGESLEGSDDGKLQLRIYCEEPEQDEQTEKSIADAISVLTGEVTDFSLLNLTPYGYTRWDNIYLRVNNAVDMTSEILAEENSENLLEETDVKTDDIGSDSDECVVNLNVEPLTDDIKNNFIYDTEYYVTVDDYMLYEHVSDVKGTNYFVVSFVPDKLENKGTSWQEGDLYVQTDYLLEEAYYWLYNIYGMMISSLLLFLATFIFLTMAAGHHRRKEGISGTWIEKIPLEILWAAAGVIEVFILILMVESIEMIDSVTSIFWMVFSGVFAVCGAMLAMGCYLDFVVRIKLGKWWRSTLTWKVCHWIRKHMKQAVDYFVENAGLFWKIIIGYGVICFIECIILFFIYDYNEPGWILWLFLFKAIVLGFLLKCVAEMRKLKTAGEHFAAGDLQYQVDTSKMYFDFKKHGENLNSLSHGLSKAVDARMKSEHFKTELITNVSHDIKTPLTSIINYVDLLKKEEIANETALEYIEVLDRQSARLKKLIEDLMEASKASTGNLAVNLEKLEAGVFMVQTVGEFEEKTNANNLELLIKKPEEPVYIMADGRHFWRVIDNLMNNICKYAQPGTRVYINLEVKDKKVYIVFRNTSKYALNISSEELMERFVRGDSSRNTEGSGLGLSIAKSLMELMHGKFELFVDGDLFKVVLTFDEVK